MDSDSLKNSLKILGIFLLTALILFFAVGTERTDLGILWIILIPFLIFLVIIFYFLFKYQKDEYYSKSMFWKIPLIAAIIGGLYMIILVISSILTCSGEGCMAAAYLIWFGIPGVVIGLAIIGLILTLNAWYKTNLYIVAWTIFTFVLIPGILLIISGQGLEEQSIVMPFGFIVGTLLAIYFKKAPPEIKKAINKGALIGGLIISLLTFIILYIIGEFKNIDLNNLEGVYNFFIVSLVIIIISVLLGVLIGYIIGKIKQRN